MMGQEQENHPYKESEEWRACCAQQVNPRQVKLTASKSSYGSVQRLI